MAKELTTSLGESVSRMSGVQGANSGTGTPKPLPLMAAVLVGYAIGAAVIVGIMGAAAKSPAKALIVPFFIIWAGGLVLAPLVVWLNRVPRGTKAFGVRAAVLSFGYLEALVVGLVLSAVRLGIEPRAEGLHQSLPFLVVAVALLSPLQYVMWGRPSSPMRSGPKP